MTQVEVDFESIVEAAPDAVLVVSAQGEVVHINAQAERMFGYTRQELLGQPLEILLPLRLRETHARCRAQYALSPSTRPMGTVSNFLARRRDGSEFSVDVSLSPTAGGGVIAIARDITDRQRINQELRELTATLERRVGELARQTNILESILNSMGEGVIVCDHAGKLLLANPAARRLHPTLYKMNDLLEYDSVAGELGLFLTDTLTPYPVDQLPLIRVIRGEDVDGLEVFIRPPGTSEGIWATVTGRPLRDGLGNVTGGVVVVRDTTASKFAQRALYAGQEAEGKRIARELHDSVCQDLCCLVLEMTQLHRDLPSSLRSIGDRINSQKEKLRELSEEVSSVCRQLHPSVLERIGLVRALEQLCQEFADRNGLHIRFSDESTPADLPLVSASCAYQVAREALRNILRHAHSSNATLRLSVTRGWLHLSVEDDGVGFDPKAVADKARLGLVGMQERVRLIGGVFSLHSAPGHGTRIELQIPLIGETAHPRPSCTSSVTASV